MTFASRAVSFTGAGGVPIAADVGGDPAAPTVILSHGGGQTRHSWSGAMTALVQAGFHVINFDLRGHGESGWAADGAYQIEDRAGDVAAILKATGARVILVGASMGGNTFLYASATLRIAPLALVLVDIVPKPDVAGVSRIKKFMQSHLDGFATLDEALEAVAAYNPNRRRTNSPDGLRKNLRERNGRLYWHWDPAILEITAEEETRKVNVALGNPVEPLTFPALLVRGAQTDVVSAEGIEGLRAYLPHLEVTDVTGAGHMVAGDRNDVFNRAIVDFLAPLK